MAGVVVEHAALAMRAVDPVAGCADGVAASSVAGWGVGFTVGRCLVADTDQAGLAGCVLGSHLTFKRLHFPVIPPFRTGQIDVRKALNIKQSLSTGLSAT